jgi:phosphoribosylformylglycinamidine synthase
VGDPFAEKLLIEASLELVERGLLEGLQDLGAAGLTCAVSEMADRAGTGMRVDLDAIPRREEGMAPVEVMISESQERMLAIVRPDRLDAALLVCARWGLPATVIGEVTDDGLVTVLSGTTGVSDDMGDAPTARPQSRVLAAIPAAALTSEAIVCERTARAPTHRRAAPAPGAPPSASDHLPDRGMDPGAVLRALLGSPNLGSRAWITTQYDATVGANTLEASERAAGILRLTGTTKGLACATDAVAGVGAYDPYLGAALAVAECTRNVVVAGARPLGVTNCLNYGDPERPEAFWQLCEGVRGLADACRALGVPITGGNVSLYNESPAGRILPTAQIGVVGLLEDVRRRVTPQFRRAGDLVVLLGEAVPGLAGSAYAELAGSAIDERLPSLDLAREAALQRLLLAAAQVGILASAQDVCGGGLAVALAECSIWGGVGARLSLRVSAEPAVELFGESPSRALVSLRPADLATLAALAAEHGVPLEPLGEVGGDRLAIELVGGGAAGAAEERGASVADALDCTLAVLRHAWEQALPGALGDDAFVPPRER